MPQAPPSLRPSPLAHPRGSPATHTRARLQPPGRPGSACACILPSPGCGLRKPPGGHRAEQAERASQQRASGQLPPEPLGLACRSEGGFLGSRAVRAFLCGPARGALLPPPGTLALVGEEGVTLGGATGQPWRVVPAAPQGGGQSPSPGDGPLCPHTQGWARTRPGLGRRRHRLPGDPCVPGLSWPSAGSTHVSPCLCCQGAC